MRGNDSKEQKDRDGADKTARSGKTNSGMPNPEDPTKSRSTEHKSGYGGEGGEPRTSSDQRKPSDG
jgi:hypothetical protein